MTEHITFVSKSSGQTKKIGRILAEEILKSSLRDEAFVLGLKGDLGGGKTTFLQGFALGLGIREKVLSPTFIIFRRNEITGSRRFKSFFHFDCYRIESPKEISKLGFKKIISQPYNIVAVEWSERIKELLPKDTFRIKFEFIDKNTRKITLFA